MLAGLNEGRRGRVIGGQAKVIEADFAQSSGSNRVAKERREGNEVIFPAFVDMVGMDTNGMPNISRMGYGKIAVERPVSGFGADGDEADDTSSFCLGAIVSESPGTNGIGWVAVGI